MIARVFIGAPRVRGRLRRLSRGGILGTLVAGGLLGGGAAGAAPPGPPARIQARFDLDAGAPSPFPADWLTVPDRAQRTGLRIANPPVSCAPPRSVCDDGKLLAELDGFDLEPRLALRFTGVIDLGSVSPRSVFLVRLGAGPPEITGIDRLVWDPATFTLYARPESVLEPETRYGLVVTRELRDSGGRSVEPSASFAAMLRSGGGPPLGAEHRAAFGLLRRALERRLIRLDRVVVASVFTTGSVSAFLEQARDALDRRPPAAALMTAPEGGGRAWFARGLLSRLVLRRQVGPASALSASTTASDDPPDGFRDDVLPLEALPRDVVGGIGIGWYWSPWHLSPERRIFEPPTGGAQRAPSVDRAVPFVIVMPAGRPPPEGWPLVVFGHGYGGEMLSSALLVAGGLARHGIATIAISVVGHGGGPESQLLVQQNDGRRYVVRVPGRGVDLDGDGRIGSTEGLSPLPGGPLAALGLRDGLRQQVVDLMALVRAVGSGNGFDVDGDGVPDTGKAPITYAGHSLGGIYGTVFLAVEPRVRVGALVVPGGPVSEVARLSPVFRPLVKEALARRTPPLLNLSDGFREDLPLHGDGPVVAPAPGALAIQEYLARVEWLGRRADPVAYARHLWRSPLPGVDPARVLVEYALGDRVVPNPTTAALVRAGALGDRTVVVRTDRVVRASAAEWPDPHGFLLAVRAPGLVGRVAMLAQEQVARFLKDEGETLWIPESLSSAGPDSRFLSFDSDN
ncbi:MAG TPA: hypothetical protein VIE44_04355 [Methylomirabilota bacterium]